jgi:hypothetical protein
MEDALALGEPPDGPRCCTRGEPEKCPTQSSSSTTSPTWSRSWSPPSTLAALADPSTGRWILPKARDARSIRLIWDYEGHPRNDNDDMHAYFSTLIPDV